MAAVQSLVTLTANFCAILVDEGLGNIAQINLAGPIKEKGAMSDEIDLEGLDAYLMSDDSPENCMMLSDLDGFLHGVICSPIEVPQAECLRKAMGGPFSKVPPEILQAITDIYDNIGEGMALPEPEAEPIFWRVKESHVIAMD